MKTLKQRHNEHVKDVLSTVFAGFEDARIMTLDEDCVDDSGRLSALTVGVDNLAFITGSWFDGDIPSPFTLRANMKQGSDTVRVSIDIESPVKGDFTVTRFVPSDGCVALALAIGRELRRHIDNRGEDCHA